RGCFALSSLGPRWPAALEPQGLDAPLVWLADALQAQDEARLDWLWSAGVKLDALGRCVAAFAQRYPEAPATARHREPLRGLVGRRRRRRAVAGLLAAACLVMGLGGYDVLGRRSAESFAADHADDPAAALARWQTYQAQHPTRALFQPGATRAEE